MKFIITKFICFVFLFFFPINANFLTERFENLTQKISSPDNSYELLYKEALKLYEELKTKKKKTDSEIPALNPKNNRDENQEEEEKNNNDETVEQEIEEKGVKININLNGDGKRNPEKDFENSLYVIQDLLKELVSMVIIIQKQTKYLGLNKKKEAYKDLDTKMKDQDQENVKKGMKYQSLEKEKAKLISKLEEIKGQNNLIGNDQNLEEIALKKNEISSIFKEIQDKTAEIENTADLIDLPLSEYERSNKDFLEANNKKLSLENENKEALKDLENLRQKQEEGDLLMQNLNKKKDFFQNNIKVLNNMINSKEEEKKKLENERKNISNMIEVYKQKREISENYYFSNESESDKSRNALKRYKKGYKQLMDLLVELDQNITYQRNILKEKEMEFDLERETEIKDIEDLDIKIEIIKKDFSQNLVTKKQSLDLETNEIKSLTSLQNHLIQEQRKNMDYLIINKLLKGKKPSRLNKTKKIKGKIIHKSTSPINKPTNIDEIGISPIEKETEKTQTKKKEGDKTSKPKKPIISPFPLTKMPTSGKSTSKETSGKSSGKSSSETTSSETTSSETNTSKTKATPTTDKSPSKSSIDSSKSSEDSESKSTSDSNHKVTSSKTEINTPVTSGKPSSETKSGTKSSETIYSETIHSKKNTPPKKDKFSSKSSIDSSKSSEDSAETTSDSSSSSSKNENTKGQTSSNSTKTSSSAKITSPNKTKINRFKGEDSSFYTDYSDFSQTDPKDMMFFDSE